MGREEQQNVGDQTTKRDIGKCFLDGALFGIVVAVLTLAIG